MTAGYEHLEYRRLRAPQEDGTALFDPTWDRVGAIVDRNAQRHAQALYDVHGKCLRALADQARQELVDAAQRWTATYRDVSFVAHRDPTRIFLAGHQPQMFHPGVWLKNFALDRLAADHNAVGVNLIVDSDTIRGNTLRVPGGSPETPNVANIAFDASGPVVPFEERQILDRQIFEQFAGQAGRQIAPLIRTPVLQQYWPLVQSRAAESDRLGLCLAQARHQLEGQWNLKTLEIPQSAICDSASFRWFLCHLLDELPRFREIHNAILGQYRRSHRIRSAVHPASDLAQNGDWIEAPFWIWSVDSPRRRRLFVRRRGPSMMELTNRDGLTVTLPLGSGDLSGAVDGLHDLAEQGVRIRSRALITTMWARIALGDLFIHGIGGAKYDQVTSALIAGFFGLQPSQFLTVSATLHLPIQHPASPSLEAPGFYQQQLRRLEYQPDRFLDLRPDSAAAEARQLAEEKWLWINNTITPENYRERFFSIRRLNRRLQAWVEPQRQLVLQDLKCAEQAATATAIHTWREYGFCLFPGETLRDFFCRLLPKRA